MTNAVAYYNSNMEIGDSLEGRYTGTLSENTKRAYIRDILDFFRVSHISEISIGAIQSVDSASAQRFREQLRSEGKAVSTINRKMTSLSSFFSFLSRKEIGIIGYNPFSAREGAVRLKQNKRYSNTRCLTVDEVKLIVRQTMEDNDILSIRNRIIVLLLASTGIRRAELTYIRLGNVKVMRGKDIIEILGKGEKERLVVIPSTVKKYIDEYIAMRGLTYENKNEFLVVRHSKNGSLYKGNPNLSEQAIYNLIKDLSEKAGLDSSTISPHSLRHTFTTESLELGIHVQDVADMLGHTDISTTRRYDHTRRVVENSPSELLENMFLDK